MVRLNLLGGVMSNRIKELRDRNRMSLRDLAEVVGVSAPTISSWEYEKTDISYSMANKLAEFFGVSLEYLLGISDDIEQNEIHAHRRGNGPVDDSDVNLAKSLEMIIKQYEAGYLTQDEFN